MVENKDMEEYKLSELLEIKYGKDHRSLSDGKIPCYGTGGLMRYVDKFLYDEESILIPRKGSLENLYYINRPFWTVDTLFWSKINKDLVIPKFLFYKLKTLNFSNLNEGSAIPSLTTKTLNQIIVNIPDLETQEKIASILSALDDKIELNNEMSKTLEEMAQTLFKRWFIDFDFPNEKGEPYRCSGGKMVDSELGEIPEEWEVTKIENVVNIKRGASPRPIQDYISDNGIPWIKISDATSSISKFLNKTNEFIIEKGKEKSRFIERGTLILSNSATPGIPMIVNLDACVHDGWLIFNEYKNITKEFLYYVLKYHKENILALSNGSVFRNLKTDILKNYKIILPNLDLIILFNQSLEIIDKYIRNNVEEIQSLTEIRDALLPKLMSGEVEV